MTLPLYRCWEPSETEIVAALDSSWKSQYREFEFTSLRHAVSTAEKLCFIARKISEKGRLFAVFPQPTGPENMAAEPRRSRSSGFYPEALLVVRFQESVQANALRPQTEHSAKAT